MPDERSTYLDASTFAGRLDTATRSATFAADRMELRLPGLTVLCHPDLRRIGERAVLPALASDQEAHLSRLEPLFSQPGSDVRRPLADPRLSRSPLVLRPGPNGEIHLLNPSGKIRITADGVRVPETHQFSAEELDRGVVWLIAEQVTLALHLMDPLTPEEPSFGLVGESLGIQNVRRQIARVADLDVPCLIRGETGTGKELVAQAIHKASHRSPFEAINMGAIPPTLAASELFGAGRGAFTGADRKREGAFQRADGGTLFMDEVGETPQDVQALLLRALETSRVRPVGGEREKEVSVRFLAATDADLETEVAEGRFRGPLVHRLGGYEIHLPPLRRRKEDLGRLIIHFLGLELTHIGERHRLEHPSRRAWLPAPLVARLAVYSWPGNVRQLRNVVRQLVIGNRGESVLRISEDLALKLSEDIPAPSHSPPDEEAETAISEPDTASRAKRPKSGIRALAAVELIADDGGSWKTQARARRLLHRMVLEYEGQPLSDPDGCFVFEDPAESVGSALELQQSFEEWGRRLGPTLEGRVGIVMGRIQEPGAQAVPDPDDVQKAVSLKNLARPRQILMDRAVYELTRRQATGDHPLADPAVRWSEHGLFPLPSPHEDGSLENVEIFEAGLEGLAPLTAPERADDSTKQKPTYRPPDDVNEDELLSALRDHGFRLQPTAAALNISRTSLYALIEKSPRVRKAKDLSRKEIADVIERHAGDLDKAAAELEVSRKGLRRQMTRLGFD